MDILDLLQQIEKQQLAIAKNNKDRIALEKIYHTLEIIDNSISGLTADNDDKIVRETLSFDELLYMINDKALRNNKDAKNVRVRIPRIPRDVAKDGNHPLLAELYTKLKQMRQRQQSDQDMNNGGDDNSEEATIDRMIDDVSTALDEYDNNRISFEVSGKQYSNLIKWEKSIDESLFRYQLETGKMWPGSDYVVSESTLERFKVIAKEGGTDRPYYGALEGDYLYKFCPTSLGLITKVENLVTKEVDLTNYESW